MSLSLTVEDVTPCLWGKRKTVLTTLTNYGYALYTLNMLKSLKEVNPDQKVLVVSLDKKAHALFQQRGYHSICVDTDLEDFNSWNQKRYDKICYFKVLLIYRVLSLGLNVMLIDGDIVFHKDPMMDIVSWESQEENEVWIQNDHQMDNDWEQLCTGYHFIRSTPTLIELYDCVSDAGLERYRICAMDHNDQLYFNKYVKPHCSFKVLPLINYPNGKMFYDNCSSIMATAVMVHFNWVIGHEKMARMKRHHMWILTEEEEEI